MFQQFKQHMALRGSPVLLGIPFDANSSFRRGAAKAPELIRQAVWSDHSNLGCESGIDLSRPEHVFDAGDVCEAGTAYDAVLASTKTRIDEIRCAGGVPLILGGDHSVTFAALSAFQSVRPHLVVVDAHPDLYDHYLGSRESHASWCLRSLEADLLSGVTLVGIRTMTDEQRKNAKRFGVHVVDMRAWENGDRPRAGGATYLSVDIDGIDPAHAPGVSHPEPGGLTVREVLQVIRKSGALIGADIVEYNPDCDLNGGTATVCAKILKEICGRILMRPF